MIDHMVGRHLLTSVRAIVRSLKVPARLHDDATQEGCLAHLEGRDIQTAVQTFIHAERRGGLTGHNPKTVARPVDGQTESAEEDLLRRELERDMREVAGAVWVALSARDRRIVQLTIRGWTQQEIADLLGMSQQQVSKILAKTQTKSRALLKKRRESST